MLGDRNSYVKAVDECIPCILRKAKTILERTEVENSDEIVQEIETQLISLSLADTWLLSRSTTGLCPAQFGSIRQQILEKYGYGNTYLREKQFGQQMGKQFYSQLSGRKVSWVDALIYSLIGNGMEFDPKGEYREIQLQQLLEEKEKIHNNSSSVIELSTLAFILENKDPGNLVFIFDNAGEEYFDLPLLENFAKRGWSLTGIIKGGPVLNDLSVEDEMDLPVEMSIHSTGGSEVGIFLSKIPDDIGEMLDNADLIISKGMANFETLSSEVLSTECLYLLKAKCEPVANITGNKLNDYVFKLQEGGKPWL